MLRFHSLVCLGLACAFVLPAALVGPRQDEPVTVTLEKTLAALEQLAGLGQRLCERDPSAIAAALAATEAPSAGEPAARDALLDALRGEVVALQGVLEGDAPLQPSTTTTATTPPAPPATTGLDEARLRALAPLTSQANTTTRTVETARAKHEFEDPGYAADSLRLAHAYYREGKLERALLLFETTDAGAESSYWRARCLERLGRTAEALDAYVRVVAAPNAGWHAARAAEDVEFLRWRIALERKVTERAGERP